MELLGQIIAGLVTGLGVAGGLRAVAIPREVSDHDARVEELNADHTRWVRDRDRQLDAEIFRALNLARQGVIEDVVKAQVPKELEHLPEGSQADSGAFVNRVQRIMLRALHEYRDEASRKVREYKAMARSEGRTHRFLRERRSDDPPAPLRLPEDARKAFDTWREREVPVHGKPTAKVEEADDPTRQDAAADIRPLESDEGLTWEAARRGKISGAT